MALSIAVAPATEAIALPMADDFPLDDDGYDDLSEPEFPLPDGVSKEILTEAGTSQWLKPKVGSLPKV